MNDVNLEQDEGVVAISFGGIDDLSLEMESLSKRATTLHEGLDELEATLKNNWEDETAVELLSKYKSFTENIDIIVKDINDVNEWSQETAEHFLTTVGNNTENVRDVLRNV